MEKILYIMSDKIRYLPIHIFIVSTLKLTRYSHVTKNITKRCHLTPPIYTSLSECNKHYKSREK